MKTVYILIPFMGDAGSVSGAHDMFRAVNTFLEGSGKPPCFDIFSVGLTAGVSVNNGLATLHPTLLLEDAGQADLIIIPALTGSMEQAIVANNRFTGWLAQQHRNGAEIASLCVGAFLLAASGLLDDRYCSTHWFSVPAFRELFPKVKLVDERVITDQDGIYSSGGANSYWNLLLYVVEKYAGREVAIMASKYFLIDTEKTSQLPFTIFKGQQLHGDELILYAQSYIEQHYDQKFNVKELARIIKLERRTFERRFYKATSNTVVEYMQRVRVEAAKKQLEADVYTVKEIMYDVGYNDLSAFRAVFKKYTGLTLDSYRKRYKQTV